MKLSLFTPTHNPVHLPAVYKALKEQDGEIDWQWVIVPNGSCTALPDAIVNDVRVKIVNAPDDVKGIGALKRFACLACDGDVFVEMDHDDILTSNCFLELAEAYNAEPTGFYYSDVINLRENGTCELYSAKHGWTFYDSIINNRHYTACSSFLPTARAICQIFFAPNHIRAWSRTAYVKSGGHDATLSVGDDHELVCRTYITGAPFVYISKALYIYRRWRSQTFPAQHKDIRKQQTITFNKYLWKLIAEECRRHAYPVITLDDLANAQSNSIGCIRAIDALQHINRNDIISVMNSAYDALRPGGWLISRTPTIADSADNITPSSFNTDNTKSFWLKDNFKYFTQQKFASRLSGYTGRFQLVRNIAVYLTEKNQQLNKQHLITDLCALKGQRQPGEVFI